MRHRINKFKLRGGYDANKMLLRKLAFNFIAFGKMTTTEKKAKALQTYLSRLLEKSKEKNEANKNYLLHHFNSVDVVNKLFDTIGPSIKSINGGYMTSKRLQQRYSDGATMVQVEWSFALPQPAAEAPVKEKKAQKAVTEAKTEAPKKTARKTSSKKEASK